MKKRLFPILTAFVLSTTFIATTSQESANAKTSNVIMKKTNKTYTYVVIGSPSKAYKNKNAYYFKTLDFYEDVSAKGDFRFNVGSVGNYKLPKNFYKTKKASYEGERGNKKTVKASVQTVKTKYKTFKNAYVLRQDSYTMTVVKGYGVVKASTNGRIIFQLKSVK